MRRSILFLLAGVLLLTGSSADAGDAIFAVNSTYPEAFSRPGADFWAAGGAGVAELGLSSAAISNPATMEFSDLGVYLEGADRFDATLLAWPQFDGVTEPSLAVVSFPLGTNHFAVGLANTYDLHLSETIPITTEQFPDGTGQTSTDAERVIKEVAFMAAQRSIGEDLSVGATIGMNYINADLSNFTLDQRGVGIGAFLTAGVVYRISDRLQLGSTMHCESFSTFDISSRSSPSYSQQVSSTSPWTWNTGLSWNAAPALKLLGSIEYQHWSIIGNNYNNIAQFHAGAEISPSNTVTLRFGFFTQNAPEQGEQQWLDENFITAGLRVRLSVRFAFSVEGMDSRPLSNSSYSNYDTYTTSPDLRQSSVSAGVSYNGGQ